MSLESRIVSVIQAIGADIKVLLASAIPSMTGNAGKVLMTDGNNPIWSSPDNYIDGGSAAIVYGSEDPLINCGGAT